MYPSPALYPPSIKADARPLRVSTLRGMQGPGSTKAVSSFTIVLFLASFAPFDEAAQKSFSMEGALRCLFLNIRAETNALASLSLCVAFVSFFLSAGSSSLPGAGGLAFLFFDGLTQPLNLFQATPTPARGFSFSGPPHQEEASCDPSCPCPSPESCPCKRP